MDRETEWRKQRGTLVSVTVGAILAGGILCFWFVVCGGYALGAMIGIAAFTALGCVHYYIWGRGMSNEVADERRAEELRQFGVGPSTYEDDEPHDYYRH